jgi:hypothetical protein
VSMGETGPPLRGSSSTADSHEHPFGKTKKIIQNGCAFHR